jgi:DNA-binding NarL/FixJ family response regulator
MNTEASSLPIKVAVVEDLLDLREALEILLSGTPGITCVAACASAEEALSILPKKQPEVVLMDIELPGMNGVQCIRRLKMQPCSMQFLVLTVFEDHERIFKSLEAGAAGYILKKSSPAKLVEAIVDLHNGGAPMSSSIARQVVERFAKPAAPSKSAEVLSARERQILDQLSQGFLYKEIAAQLGITISTVRVHIRNIYEKLHARNRIEAINKGLGRDPR